MKVVIQHFRPLSEFHSTLSDQPQSQATSYLWFERPGDGVIGAPSKHLQRHKELEVVDELVEIGGQYPYCKISHLVL